MLLLVDAILEQDLHQIMEAIDAQFAKEEAPKEHERRRQREYRPNIRAEETIEEFINCHLEIRKDMGSAKYPGIGNEAMTIYFLIGGIDPRPNFPILEVHRCRTIWDLRTTLEVPNKSAPQLADTLPTQNTAQTWYELHKSYTKQTTSQLRFMKREQAQSKLQAPYTSAPKYNQYTQYIERPPLRAYHGLPRGRGWTHTVLPPSRKLEAFVAH